jgi:hypothetical protein
MATVREMMVDSLAKASKAAEQITSSVERAKAFTDLAEACASALSVKDVESTEIEASAPVKKEEAEEKKKATPKKEKETKKSKKKAEPEPEAEAEEKEEHELTEEWDSYAMETLAEGMAKFEAYRDQFEEDEDTLNELISDATEGTAKNVSDVNPLNIKLILDYIKQLEDAAAEEEEEDEE